MTFHSIFAPKTIGSHAWLITSNDLIIIIIIIIIIDPLIICFQRKYDTYSYTYLFLMS